VNFRQQEVELLKQQVQAYENIIEHFKRELLVVQGKLSNYPPHREAQGYQVPHTYTHTKEIL